MYAYGLWHFSTDRSGKRPYFYFHRLFTTLEGAKNAAVIKKNKEVCLKLTNSTWFIVPVQYAFERTVHIKYQLHGDTWVPEVDGGLQDAFTAYRERV